MTFEIEGPHTTPLQKNYFFDFWHFDFNIEVGRFFFAKKVQKLQIAF